MVAEASARVESAAEEIEGSRVVEGAATSVLDARSAGDARVPLDSLASRARGQRARSFLERVIAGTNAGPLPGIAVLDPGARHAPARESDGAQAKRAIDRLVRSSAARGAPKIGAGPAAIALVALEDGTFRYQSGGFVATIGIDGGVTFIDLDNKAGLGASGLPGRDRDNLLEPYGSSIDAPASVDGTRRSLGDRMDNAVTLGSGTFDPTAALLRAQGQDPYEHEKICFLDDTQGLRADLRKAHERAQMGGLRRSLERAWFDDSPASARRAALFAVWDECREEEVGLLARELIESFVRQHLPSGSVDAFPAAELAALNARRTSTLAFKPYG